MDFTFLDYEVSFDDLKQFNYPNQKLGVIAHIENAKGEILLQQRGEKSRDENGLYEDIGGKVDITDTNFKEALMREIKEEAGDDLKLEFSRSVGIFHYYKNNINWLFVIYYVKYLDGEFKIMEPDKCLNYRFFTCDEALDSSLVTSGCKYLIKSVKEKY